MTNNIEMTNNICPNCGGNFWYDKNKEQWSCDTCSFPECPNCGETITEYDDYAFVSETGVCPYCNKEMEET